MATTVVPTEQGQAFQAALVRRLGLNPDEVMRVEAEATDGQGIVTATVLIPEHEILEMFNAAGRTA